MNNPGGLKASWDSVYGSDQNASEISVEFRKFDSWSGVDSSIMMKCRADIGNIDLVVSRLGLLPLFIAYMKGSGSALEDAFERTVSSCASAHRTARNEQPFLLRLSRLWGSGQDDLPAWFRAAERCTPSWTYPNPNQALHVYIGLLFYMSPTMWRPLRQGEVSGAPDITVDITTLIPDSRKTTAAYSSRSLDVFEITAAPAHVDHMVASKTWDYRADAIEEWSNAFFQHFGFKAFHVDRNTGSITTEFNTAYLAMAYMRAANLPTPRHTFFGVLPWKRTRQERRDLEQSKRFHVSRSRNPTSPLVDEIFFISGLKSIPGDVKIKG